VAWQNPSAFSVERNTGLALSIATLRAAVRAWEIAMMDESTTLTIEPVLRPTADVRALISELDQILSAEYPPEQRHALKLDAIFAPHIRFFLARLGEAAMGCGGVALFPDFAEVKRMYVRPVARGKGVAQGLLARIEAEARKAALPLLRLETGDRQLAAIRFYGRSGFRRCGAFGEYATKPFHTIATSVFFEKHLSIWSNEAIK
jgi:putative acetyltransferase